MTDNRTTEHVCAKCGKQLDPVNWWTASVADRYGGQSYKLCKPCAESVSFAMQAVISMDGPVAAVTTFANPNFDEIGGTQ